VRLVAFTLIEYLTIRHTLLKLHCQEWQNLDISYQQCNITRL